MLREIELGARKKSPKQRSLYQDRGPHTTFLFIVSTPTATAALRRQHAMVCCWLLAVRSRQQQPIDKYYSFTTRFFQFFVSKKLQKVTTSCLCCANVVHRQWEIRPRRLHSMLCKKQMQHRRCRKDCELPSHFGCAGTTQGSSFCN